MALGLRSVADDIGIKYELTIQAEATAASGMARRGGIGKVRHLNVSLLWIQSAIRRTLFTVRKVLGTENMSDALTKYLDRPDLEKHTTHMHVVLETGRASSAPTL